MKAKLIFFGVFFLIQLLVNLYIYMRGVAALHEMGSLKRAFQILMIVAVVAYPLGRWLDSVWYSPVSVTLHWFGSFWFAAMLYLVMMLVAIDLVRLANLGFQFLPASTSESYIRLKQMTFFAVSAILFLIIVLGHINAWYPKTVRKTIHIAKNADTYQQLKVVAVSDIHLGTIIGPRKTAKLVNSVNALQPDIILLAGDVIDEDIRPVISQNLGKSLQKLKAPLGVWAIPGNHEYIGGAEAASEYLTKHGINILTDKWVLIDNSFYVVGRDDRDGQRFAGKSRKPMNELMQGVDTSHPVIVLNHQPHEFDQAEAAGADIHISGHTHYGQLWPFGYITDAVFELARGHKQKGNTHFFVSTGFGTWGPPVRTGNRPEIIELTLTFGTELPEK